MKSRKIFRKRRKTDRVAASCGPACPNCGKTTSRWTWKDPVARANTLGKPCFASGSPARTALAARSPILPEAIALVFPSSESRA
jgi:hypothetical protein